jgi:2-(1,2-epoxy-1,2-dihydrophenyl)acetyl-CoA isomerase
MRDDAASGEVLIRIDGHVAVVTLNRPESYNSLSSTLMVRLAQNLSDLAADPEIGCVVITGAGKAFSSGGDVKAQVERAKDPAQTPEKGMQELRGWMESGRLLHEMPKPTIAMVNGVAAGAGMGIALACDIRIVAQSARMTTAFAKVGLSGDFAGHYFLTRLAGTARARELFFTSDIIDSKKIEAYGLANQVVPDADLEKVTMELAHRLGNGPRVAWRYMKMNMKMAEEGSLAQLMDAEALGIMRCRLTEDHKEASQAFTEKRAPVFKGK